MAIVVIIGAYILFVFVFLRLVIPGMGFRPSPLPRRIPGWLSEEIERLSREYPSKHAFLRASYQYLTRNYQGGRMKTILLFWHLFYSPFRIRSGYIPCTTHNLLLRLMLIRSGKFREEDIRTQVVFLNFSLHQYLKVRIGSRLIFVDPNSHYLGVPFGSRAIFFD